LKKIILPGLLSIALVFSLVSRGEVRGPLANLIKVEKGFSEKETIRLSVKTLSPEESEKYLTQDVLDLGYMPVQITVENKTADPYRLSPSSIGLDLASAEKVAEKISRKALPRTIFFKLAGFVFWPLTIPSTINSLMTIKNRNNLEKKLTAKSVKDEIIPAYSTVNRVFFVALKEYRGEFDVSLQNLENLSSKIFHIEAPQEDSLQTVDHLPTVEENYYLTHES
jgi:hypothetical protein